MKRATRCNLDRDLNAWRGPDGQFVRNDMPHPFQFLTIDGKPANDTLRFGSKPLVGHYYDADGQILTIAEYYELIAQ